MMNLNQLVSTPTSETGGSSNFQASLSQIASGFLQNIANTAAQGVQNVVENKTRSSNTQPLPDLTAAAAKPQASTFLEASAFGVSAPILLVGVAALAFVLLRR